MIVGAVLGQVSCSFMATPPPIQLAGLGMADSLILMVLALVVFGPRRLPMIGRQLGKLMFEFRKASNDFKFQMEEELRLAEEADRRKKEEAARLQTAALAAPETIEAQAGVGAVESGTPSPYPGELQYPENLAPQPEPEPVQYPRIAPPSTGEQVSADAPSPAPAADAAAEANIGAEPPSASTGPEPPNSPTEPVSQHG